MTHLQRAAHWLEAHAGLYLLVLLLAAFWHPSTPSEETLPPAVRQEEAPPAPSAKHLLAPDAHSILIETEERRLLLFKGNSLMAVYPIRVDEEVPRADPPEGRFVVSGLSLGSTRGTQLYLTYSDRRGADRGLSSGLLDRAAHARIVQSLAEGELPAEVETWGRTFAIHGPSGAEEQTAAGVPLEDEYVSQLAQLVRVGTPVEIRR